MPAILCDKCEALHLPSSVFEVCSHFATRIDEFLEENKKLKESAERDLETMATFSNAEKEERERRQATERELERWRHNLQIEGDYVCPDSLRANEAEARVRELEEKLAAVDVDGMAEALAGALDRCEKLESAVAAQEARLDRLQTDEWNQSATYTRIAELSDVAKKYGRHLDTCPVTREAQIRNATGEWEQVPCDCGFAELCEKGEAR